MGAPDPLHVSLPPGSYVILVAKAAPHAVAVAAPAGEGDEGPEEAEGDEGPEEVDAQAPPNGRIERFSVRVGETVSKTFTVQVLNRSWPGI